MAGKGSHRLQLYPGEGIIMARGTAGKTIDEVLDEFLDEQEARLGRATYSKYETPESLITTRAQGSIDYLTRQLG